MFNGATSIVINRRRPLAPVNRWIAVAVVVATILAGCTRPAADAEAIDPLAENEDRSTVPPRASTPPPTPTSAAPGPANATTNETPEEPAIEPVARVRGDGVVIAILDSGIRADHQSFAPGQVVAWFDFTNDDEREVALWDPLVPEPYDDHGHGTAVASMAAGLPFGEATPSHAPGMSLAIGRVLGMDGATWVDVAEGIRWAVDVADTDIISLSIYNSAVSPPGTTSEGLNAVLGAMQYARAQGVLVVILAGNGYANQAIIPVPSWMHAPLWTSDTLVVGGAAPEGSTAVIDPIGPHSSTDPEVIAPYAVIAACPKAKNCLTSTQGTSFSTPLVAGFAARVQQAAIALESRRTPAELEDLLKRGAHDSPAPPNVEGYGLLDAASLDAVLKHIRGESNLPEPDPLTVAYMENVAATARENWGG